MNGSRTIHIGRNIPHLRLSFYFFFKVVNKSHKLFAGEIKSWWLGGLRSGPPSCVNQAVQTVVIKTSAYMVTLFSRVLLGTEWAEAWEEATRVVPKRPVQSLSGNFSSGTEVSLLATRRDLFAGGVLYHGERESLFQADSLLFFSLSLS